MKKLILIVAVILGINSTQAQSWFQWNQDEEAFISAWIDPTFNVKGFQIGGEITKELLWGYGSVGISHYAELEPAYTDIVGTIGVNFHLFKTDIIKYYTGFRGGGIFREGTPHGLLGGVAGFDVRIDESFRVGARVFADYCADQENQFYGDDSAYEKGIFTNNPMVRENYAIVLTFKL